MNDYYVEQSNGQLKITGKAFDYVEVSKKRMEYNTGDRFVLLREAMDKLLVRDGKDALKDFDGVFFIYAGGRTQVARGSLYWPHKSNVSHNGKSWPYFICPEGGERMANISVFCHEFGHMLGLPDLYARPENARHGRRRHLERHGQSGRRRQAAAFRRVEQGEARLGQADCDRPDR